MVHDHKLPFSSCTCNLGKGTILFFDFITKFSKFMASLVEHVSAWYIFVKFQEF